MNSVEQAASWLVHPEHDPLSQPLERGLRVVAASDDEPALHRYQLLVELAGTGEPLHWLVPESVALAFLYVPAAVSPDPQIAARIEPGYPTPNIEDPHGGATLADAVRRYSGLTATKLSELFPVSRETYQRWISGALVPNEANFERLVLLRHLFRNLSERGVVVREWLLAPVAGNSQRLTPFGLLKTGKLDAVWQLTAGLGALRRGNQFRDAEGGYGFSFSTPRFEHARREDESDDFADWNEDV